MKAEDLISVLQSSISSILSNVHTIAVTEVVGVNAKTVDVRPVVARVVDGEPIELPTIIEVPPIFLGGATHYDALPVSVGSGALLLISERCYDRWYTEGLTGVAPPELRMFDYSDGFALVGIRTAADAIDIPSVAVRFGNQRIVGDLHITGSLTVDGSIEAVGDITAGPPGAQVSLLTHTHLDSVGGTTESPIPGGS